jgi:hypothetical protein
MNYDHTYLGVSNKVWKQEQRGNAPDKQGSQKRTQAANPTTKTAAHTDRHHLKYAPEPKSN